MPKELNLYLAQHLPSHTVLIGFMQNTMRLFILALVIALPLAVNAQQIDTLPTIDYSEPAEYEIAGVEVEGSQFTDIATLKSISGLKEGKVIRIPGAVIQNAIENLNRLKLFSDIQIIEDRIDGDLIYLRIKVQEKATLSKHTFTGVKKSTHEDLNGLVSGYLIKGSLVTDHMKDNSRKALNRHYRGKGFYDAKIDIREIPDEKRVNAVVLSFDIDKGDKVKIKDIVFEGNDNVKSKKFRKVMENTKEKRRFLAKSKLQREDLKNDKASIINYYNGLGYRDAQITNDSIWRGEDGDFTLTLEIDEGNQYYFGDIKWKGNSLYSSDQLGRVLGIKKGDIYNQELLDTRLSFSLDGRDISSLYLDDGYLFFTVEQAEVSVYGDTIDLEMRIFEGPQATIDRVVINGNDRTHDHVIRRELRTRPGEKFSRSDIIRSQREIINLGYFNPETIEIGTPVNQQKGTVDIVYDVEETPSDQLELSAGFGGLGGVVGTLGVSFNNFSLRNALEKGAWNPVPQGDGQRLSLRVQTNGQFYQSYNFSFTEPWLGGKKRNSLSVGAVYTNVDRSFGSSTANALSITKFFAGLGTQLKWPDDFFSSSTTLNIETINLDGFPGFTTVVNGVTESVSRGKFRNFSINQVFARSSIAEPLFPRSGSRISLNIQITPPYSKFRSDNFWVLPDDERMSRVDAENNNRVIRGFSVMSEGEEASFINAEENAERFSYLEYHKWRIDAEWYFNLVGKLVLRSSAKIGLLGTWNKNVGFSPFERFELGGDGLSNQNFAITGRDIIALRGYEREDLAVNEDNQGGGTVFNKFTLELRYPISLNPSSTIYGLAFIEGGNAFIDPADYNPFKLRRSVGGGLRVFLPMFGLLGFDYGWGFDKPGLIDDGAALGSFGKFSIILGFEPD